VIQSTSFPTLLALAAFGGALGSRAAAPQRATVQYLRTIPSVREFTKPRGFFPKLLTWVAGTAEGKPEITRPFATTQDSTGRLLVADPGQKGVHIYDFEHHKYRFLKGPKHREFESPMDVACDTNDDIYVSDSVRAKVFVFDTRGRFLRWIGGNQLVRPTGMVLDSKSRRLYLTDVLRHQVMIFSLDGTLLQAVGRRGTAPGEFNYPTALTLSAGRLYVVDAMNFRIQELTAEGAYVRSFGSLGTHTGTLNRPKGIAVDSDGDVYVVDALFETVQIFDPEGRLLYYFGSSGEQPGQFQLPAGIYIDPRNIIYVADSLNRRVEVFRYRRLDQ
jgi:sugar lactone lactonase YvrE